MLAQSVDGISMYQDCSGLDLPPLLHPESAVCRVYPENPCEDLMRMYNQQMACFWTPQEVDLANDVDDFNKKLSPGERHFLEHVLAFFATGDSFIMENLTSRFINDVTLPEAQSFYKFQTAMEDIHAQMYSLMLTSLVKDSDRRKTLQNAMDEMPAVAKKTNWAEHWMDSNAPFGQRLVAFACIEGIFFSGSFCAIFWLKKRNLMPGLCASNELIARDEGLHCDFATLLFRNYLNDATRPSDETVLEIVRNAVEIEKEFVSEALPVSLLGMNASLMCQYIEFVADHLIIDLLTDRVDHSCLYGAQNPFEWMELVSLEGKTNFFEKRVTEYAKAGVLTSSSESNSNAGLHIFSLEEDF